MKCTFQQDCECGGDCATCVNCSRVYSSPVRFVRLRCGWCVEELINKVIRGQA